MSQCSLRIWGKLRNHPWTPQLLKQLIKSVQEWTSQGKPIQRFLTQAVEMPLQLTYPTWSDLLWKSAAVVMSIVVLMVVVCTIDSGYLYVMVKLMRRHA